jgi:SM-20-related protein
MIAGSSPSFGLHDSIDDAALAARFARDGRVRIAPFLRDADAQRLAAALLVQSDWKRVMNSGEKVFESPVAAAHEMTAEQRARLDDAVHAAARDGFQYRFESVRVPDDAEARRAMANPLGAFATFMSSAPVLALLGLVTRATDLAFADAQATIYRAGDFLTAHDDEVPGKHRRAAYVLGLTPEWRAEWGGLLLFHDAAGDIAEGYAPGFNALSLFAVPQVHSVSLVAPFAGAPRLSVTGWLRARPD